MKSYAQRDGLLEKAYNEIQEVIKTKGIDPDKVYVSGCSAGGYMTTRMLIAYPDLFKAAMINCPALDVASERGGQTPTDEELASLKNSDTAIWLVQGETDSSVATDECSKRMFNILTDGRNDITTSTHYQEIASDFTTYETSDNKYKLSLYANFLSYPSNKRCELGSSLTLTEASLTLTSISSIVIWALDIILLIFSNNAVFV